MLKGFWRTEIKDFHSSSVKMLIPFDVETKSNIVQLQLRKGVQICKYLIGLFTY